MNATPASHPRLACRAVRLWCSVTDPVDSRHVASCIDCQAFFAANRRLEATLRHDAARAVVDPRPAFEQQIIRAVRNSGDTPASPRRSRSRPSSLAWAGAASVAAVVLAIGFLRRDSTSVQIDAPEAREIAHAVKTLSNQLVESVIPSAGAMVANNPLQQELDSIYSDARSALGFLKLNFLPSADENPLPRSG